LAPSSPSHDIEKIHFILKERLQMTRFKHAIAASVAALATLIGAPGIAHAQMDQKMDMSQMADGEIRKVDKGLYRQGKNFAGQGASWRQGQVCSHQ
jgi:hypothetical protein